MLLSFSIFLINDTALSRELFDKKYCEYLKTQLTKTEVIEYLDQWKEKIEATERFSENWLVTFVGFGPGTYQLKADVDWDLLGLNNQHAVLTLVFDGFTTKDRSKLTNIFFGERSGYGYFVYIDRIGEASISEDRTHKVICYR